MSKWVSRGLRTGIRTTRYPEREECSRGVSPGRPVPAASSPETIASLMARCPTGALIERDGRLEVDMRRCVHCFRCRRQVEHPLEWSEDYEWASLTPDGEPIPDFGHSLHVTVVDAGDCGACLHEVKQLNNPYYNMHRLGFFLTPTPRHADVLIVVGAVADQMRVPLLKTYEAMPTPKRVIAVGSCALSGGVFGPSFVTVAGVSDVIPVDVEVPGQPPPPLAILHALLVVTGGAASSELRSGSREAPGESSS